MCGPISIIIFSLTVLVIEVANNKNAFVGEAYDDI